MGRTTVRDSHLLQGIILMHVLSIEETHKNFRIICTRQTFDLNPPECETATLSQYQRPWFYILHWWRKPSLQRHHKGLSLVTWAIGTACTKKRNPDDEVWPGLWMCENSWIKSQDEHFNPPLWLHGKERSGTEVFLGQSIKRTLHLKSYEWDDVTDTCQT